MDMDMALQYEMAESFKDAQDKMAQYFGATQALAQNPHVVMKPKVYKDGDKWCCLYGDNIQEGVVGFGDTPNDACAKFDKMWWKGENAPDEEAKGAQKNG